MHNNDTIYMQELSNSLDCSFWHSLWMECWRDIDDKYEKVLSFQLAVVDLWKHPCSLMHLSIGLYTCVLPNGFFRYFSFIHRGSLFLPWTLTETLRHMKLFFKAIWRAKSLSKTEQSEGVLSFGNSVPCSAKYIYRLQKYQTPGRFAHNLLQLLHSIPG